ncbi:hypothetical protein AA313_de0201637 [Arthrobotrys entomopaga]|nr:hypothetical protein AA313_de0201637 [Arthrobotrys entomopaga]
MAPYCHRCRRSFVNRRAYHAHIENSSSHNFCFVCDEDIESLDDLIDHEKAEHDACHECEREFVGQSQLDAHLRSELHAGRRYPCVCDETFVSPSGLLLHIEGGGCSRISGHEMMHLMSIKKRRTMKRGYKPGDDICMSKDDTFLTYPNLALLLELIAHTNIAYDRKHGDYVCQYCLDRFKSPRALNQHLSDSRKNDGNVWYICDGCDHKFAYPSALCQHYESGKC